MQAPWALSNSSWLRDETNVFIQRKKRQTKQNREITWRSKGSTYKLFFVASVNSPDKHEMTHQYNRHMFLFTSRALRDWANFKNNRPKRLHMLFVYKLFINAFQPVGSKRLIRNYSIDWSECDRGGCVYLSVDRIVAITYKFYIFQTKKCKFYLVFMRNLNLWKLIRLTSTKLVMIWYGLTHLTIWFVLVEKC